MRCRQGAPLVFAAVLGLLSVDASAQPRGVLELFTSQGCSSCPPADKLIGELAHDPGLIALTMAIDYWDYLGWKDTLAKPKHTARQRGYARMRGDREIYTPQVVVNGSQQVLGSDRAAIEHAIASRRPGTLALAVSARVADGKLVVSVPAGSAGEVAEVWVCPVTKSIPVPIGRGENRGRTITYANVVRGWKRVGEWSGQARTYTMDLAEVQAEGVNAVAVLVQNGSVETPGKLLGAAIADLP
jgi:hypothetical protein